MPRRAPPLPRTEVGRLQRGEQFVKGGHHPAGGVMLIRLVEIPRGDVLRPVKGIEHQRDPLFVRNEV